MSADFLTATDIANKVRSGATTARAIAEQSLATIAAHDGDLHAFNIVTAENALRAADEIDERIARGEDPGALAGVPIAIKDNICTRGIPTTCSSKILANWKPPYDATVIDRLRAAGAIVVGKTNLDEFAMGSSTENSAFGPTSNPWDLSKVPGGSSGGSAAAVAAGLVPLSLGSDTGGSIRQPAAFCGVVGIKPTYGYVSRYGLMAFASSLDQIGPFATTVEDATVLLEVISGHDVMDSTSVPVVPELHAALRNGVEGLRVGLIESFLPDANPACVGAVRKAADVLAAAGAKVEDVSIPALSSALGAYYLIAPAEASSNLARYDGVRFGLRVEDHDIESMNTATRTAGFGPEVKRRIMLGTFALSAGYYDAYYGRAQKVRTLVGEAFNAAYADFDVLLAPTTPSPAFGMGEKVDDPLEMYLSDLFTVPSNLAGHPAISVPFALSDEGLPIGVQVFAPALGESVMLRTAQVLESGADPASRGPVTPRGAK